MDKKVPGTKRRLRKAKARKPRYGSKLFPFGSRSRREKVRVHMVPRRRSNEELGPNGKNLVFVDLDEV